MRIRAERKIIKNVSQRAIRFWRTEVQPDETITTVFWKHFVSTWRRELTDTENAPKKAEKKVDKKEEVKEEKKETKKKSKKSK